MHLIVGLVISAFLFAHEKIGTGGAMLLPTEVPRIWWMCVSMKLKVLCLRMKYGEVQQFVGMRFFNFSMK